MVLAPINLASNGCLTAVQKRKNPPNGGFFVTLKVQKVFVVFREPLAKYFPCIQ